MIIYNFINKKTLMVIIINKKNIIIYNYKIFYLFHILLLYGDKFFILLYKTIQNIIIFYNIYNL